MGIYFKDQLKGKLYQNKGHIKAHQQSEFYESHVSIWMKQQQQINDLMQRSMELMQRQSRFQEERQREKWDQINVQMKQLKEDKQQEKLMEKLLAKMGQIEENQNNLKQEREKDKHFQQQVQEQMNQLMQQYRQMEEQLENITGQIENLELQAKETSQRLEEQEAITQKIVRQLDFIRSIIFERTSYVTGKMDEYFQYVKDAISPSALHRNRPLFEEKVEKEKIN